MIESLRQYRFDTFGPFELPLETQTVIDGRKLGAFWKVVDEGEKGLPEALGCYIFAIRSFSGTLPWYVGKTEKQAFQSESVQLHKLRHFEAALRKEAGTPLLYLLPRLTAGDKFRKVWKRDSPSIANLERMLIATALSRNPELLNGRSIKHLTQTVVPGYMNDKGVRTPSAQSLAALLGTAGKEAPARAAEARSLGEIAGDIIAGTIHSLQESLGTDFAKLSDMHALFTYEEQDYRVSLAPYTEEEDAPMKAKKQEKGVSPVRKKKSGSAPGS